MVSGVGYNDVHIISDLLDPVYARSVVGTTDAGDALFSAFVHFLPRDCPPIEALERAMVKASFKLGEKETAHGFLSEDELQFWVNQAVSSRTALEAE